MAKKRQFDEAEVLYKIAVHFWEHGYTATKMDQLSDLTGLTKTSIYHAFGNKEAVFIKSVDFYVGHHLAQMSTQLDINKTMSENIHNVLSNEFLNSKNTLLSYGCLITNSILELSGNEPKLYDHVTDKLTLVRSTIYSFFNHYAEQNMLVDSINADQLTELFMTFIQGLKVQSRHKRLALTLQWAIDAFILSIQNFEK